MSEDAKIIRPIGEAARDGSTVQVIAAGELVSAFWNGRAQGWIRIGDRTGRVLHGVRSFLPDGA